MFYNTHSGLTYNIAYLATNIMFDIGVGIWIGLTRTEVRFRLTIKFERIQISNSFCLDFGSGWTRTKIETQSG